MTTENLLNDKNIVKLLVANYLVSSAVGIAMILIPWMLVKKLDGDVLTAIASIAIIMTMLVVNRIGQMIDKFQRKNILLVITIVISIVYIFLGVFPENSRAFIYMLGFIFSLKQLYFNIFFTTRLALAQSLTSKRHFGRLNGWLEIENQSAAFSAGALALLLINFMPVQVIFIVSGLLLIPAAYLFSSLRPNVSKKLEVKTSTQEQTNTPSENLSLESEVFSYKRILYFIIIAGNIPFICVMLLDVIRPIFVADVLREATSVLVLSGLFYTVGAIIGGLYCGRINSQANLYRNMWIGISAFCLVTLVLVLHTSLELFYLVSFGWGLFNSVSRIAAQTIIMHNVANIHLGRFLSKAHRAILFLRASSIVLYAILFRHIDYGQSFLFLLILSLLGPCLLLFSVKQRSEVQQK